MWDSTQIITVIHRWASVLNVYGPVDAVILDFAPHEWLLLKADYYRYRRKSNIRLQSVVTERSQRFVVNGSASSWSPVVFGMPQGTLLRPILFLMSMNDLATNITPSIKLFATTVFFTVRLIPLAIMLLSTARPRSTGEVASTRQMKFVPTKCFVMSITLKISLSQFSYLLCNAQLDGACHQKYFGVYMTCTVNPLLSPTSLMNPPPPPLPSPILILHNKIND